MRQKERELAPCHCRPWSHEPHHCRRGRKEHELEEPLKKLSAVRQRTLKAVAIENPNDADQAAEIVLSELHRDLILPLPWKSWKFKNKSKTRQKFKTEIEYLLLKLGTWQFSNKQVIGRDFDSNSNWKWFYSRTCSCIFIVNKKRRYERAPCKF
nr:uncharacterized protein LOC112702402 [Arachis hypogaea]